MVTHAQTFNPIPVALRETFLSRLANYVPTRDWPIPPVPLIRSMYWYGFHPEVYAHPRESSLQIFGNRIMGRRPKTNNWVGPNRQGNVIPESFMSWLPEFLGTLKEPSVHRLRLVRYPVNGKDSEGRTVRDSVEKWRTQDFCSEVVSREVTAVTTELGFDHVTSRCLRHTAGNIVWRRTHNIRDVMDWLSVNEVDARIYCLDGEADSTLDTAMAVAPF